MSFIKFFIIINFFIAQTTLASQKDCRDREICLKAEQNNNTQVNLKVSNQTPYTTTVLIDLKPNSILRNIEQFPFLVKLEGNERRNFFVELQASSSNQEYQIYSQWLIGNHHTSKSNYAYHLPYAKGKKYLVGQSFGTSDTHSGNMKYAADFNMNIGTAIHAARAGIVVATAAKHTESGVSSNFLGKANFIKILHADGSTATYAHLRPQGVLVKKGQRITKGKLIGYSGNTGYSTGPHLHFHISSPALQDGKLIEKSIPFKFKNCKSTRPFVPQRGESYLNC